MDKNLSVLYDILFCHIYQIKTSDTEKKNWEFEQHLIFTLMNIWKEIEKKNSASTSENKEDDKKIAKLTR